jgi:glycerol-3-phosphate dehydrogenase
VPVASPCTRRRPVGSGSPVLPSASGTSGPAPGSGSTGPPRFDPAASVADLLWRRHGDRAVAVAERIREDPTLGEPVMDLADHCRAELEVAAEHEWIVTMDDFLRRRTQLAQLHRTEALLDDPGVAEAGRVLLPDDAVDDWIRAQAPRDGSLPAAGS